MKKLIALTLCLLLLAAAGCSLETPKEEPAPAEATEPAVETEPETIAVTPPEEGTPLVQLASLDYDGEKEQVKVNFVRMNFIPGPAGAEETDYQIVNEGEGTQEQLLLSKNGTVDFPLMDDFTKTVTVTAAELPQQYADYMAAHEGATLLFTMTEADGEILSMTHFYTP